MRAGFLFLVVLAAAGLSFAVEQPASLPAVPGDAQDVVLFLDTRPYLIRLHLQINGRSFRADWNETVNHLFRYLDSDGDGCLSKKEAALAPSKTQWVQLMTGTVVEPDAAPDFDELAGKAKATTIRREQFLRYYRRSGAGALQVEWGWRPPSQDRLTEALFQYLDKDKDGNLSRAEVLAAETALNRLDVNGDEIVQANELSPGGAYPLFSFRSTSDEQPAPNNFPFTILQPDSTGAALARELLNRYDRNKDRTLSREELAVEKAAFDRLDSSRDGRLDAAELAHWRSLSPDLELIVPLENGGRKDILILPPAENRSNRLTAVLPPSRDGAVRLSLAEKHVEVVRENRGATMRRDMLKQFETLTGKDGMLSEKQIYQPPFTFVALLRLADRNGDNRLSHKELADYLAMQGKFLFRTSYLTVLDRGASLFELFDLDHDGRLSPRELRSAWKRLSVWDRDKSGRITRRQVPRQLQLVLSYGQSRASLPVRGPGFAEVPMLRDRSRGPLWFRKMDRNADGDVSQSEFLGTREQFRRIDADGDGLIDATEAERADAESRKKR
ncbi:MAG TPA: EF-hand domain-containing protein [Gemmataceae bacterium]|nr:EF-hand domain-containing protein [Gemmataceae bacterium]